MAALAYQFLPEDLISTEKFGIFGLVDNGAALALAYNRVKSRVTPQIEVQVNAVLNQWFGDVQHAIAGDVPSDEDWNTSNVDNDGWTDLSVQSPPQINTQDKTKKTRKPAPPVWDDDDVVVD